MQIFRNRDVLYGADDLEHLYTFKNFPVFMGCTDQDPAMDLSCDLSVYISRNTGVLQLNPILPLDVIYQTEHNSGSVGKMWQEHHQAFAEFIRYENPSAILEVGGGHGRLATLYGNSIEWTILEPNPKPVENCPAKIVKGFLTETTDLRQFNFDAIVHSHVFEHAYNPDQFVKLQADSLPIGGKVIFSVPNMRKMLEKKFTNCLNFEHTYFLSEEYIENLMLKNGFKMSALEYFMEDNSIFYSWIKTGEPLLSPLSTGLYEEYKRLFIEYVDHHVSLVNKMNAEINNRDNFYLFGAHVFSQYLIKFGLNTDKIVCILDNDFSKHEKRLYGTNINVTSPNVLREVKDPVVIVRAGVFTEEIKKDILENINSSVKFL
jgi:SAM-dependent methyltransferase